MKTIFDPEVRMGLIERVNRITADSRIKYGSMRPDQGLNHINTELQMYLGDVKSPPPIGILGRTVRKLRTLSPLPIPRARTPIEMPLVGGVTYSIDTEKARFPQLIERLAGQRKQQEWPIHPLMGKLSAKQYGKLAYKHTDHHLKQFGV